MRVIFMGTPDFAVPTLDALVAAGHQVVLVVSQPDRPAGRGQQLQSPPVITRARELGLPTSQPRAVRSGSFPERIASLQADVAVVIAYGRLLTQELLDAPRFGAVNLHASLLPAWRGAAPIQASLLAGDTFTGVSAQRMELGLDTGPILVERRIAVAPDETGGSLHDRLAEMSAVVAIQALDLVEHATPSPQDDAAASWAPKLDRESGRVLWEEPSVAVERRVRAMTPWPGGWVPWGKGPLKLLQVKAVDGQGAPGTVLVAGDRLVVACGQGALELLRVCAPGRKPVSGADLVNGLHLIAGDVLAPKET